ncbi:MAG: oligoendopeptidase F, partial [Fimbriimonas ginsengisoli]|nr:oligoendopeptidase F [Fimbriimonas ginsengisoli]
MSAAPSAPAAIRWDLSALFSGIDDPKIEAFWKSAKGEAEAFVARYKGKIDSPDLDAATLAGALREIEALSQEVSKPLTFAHLMFAGDTGSSEIGAFLQRQRERATELSVLLLFFDLELQAAPEEAIERAL